MMEIDKENVVQAVVIMDNFNNNFKPITTCMGLVQVAGVSLIDFTLESLAQGGVGETILFCCQDGSRIRDYIKESKEAKAPWSSLMDVQVMMSDTCQTMGDVLREIDAAGIIRSHFILTGVNTITNAPFAALLEQHKLICKKDKGAAMTIVYKKVSWGHPLIASDKSIFLAGDGNTHKVLLHQKYKQKSKEQTLSLPLEVILNHSEVKLLHNLADANISLCSPSVPPLFSDNFDFQTRDDFIHGVLINEDILASSIYYYLLKDHQYVGSITNWKTYQIVCQDILHNWAYPMSVETGTFFQDKYVHMGKYNYRHKNSVLTRSCTVTEDVLIGENTQINDNTCLSKSIIGKGCRIGKNVTISGSHIMDNVIVEDNCKILNSFICDSCIIKAKSVLDGAILATNISLKPESQVKETVVESSGFDPEKNENTKSTSESGTDWENESSGDESEEFIGFNKKWSDSESCYSSASSNQSSLPNSPIPDDSNIFLQEVIDSLARGYEEKLKCDYLILEINSSRYAYNMQLNEVNFFVVKALLSLPVLTTTKNVLSTIKDILKYLKPVVDNYIKSKSSIMDCLKAIEDSCLKCEWLADKAGQIVHLLYDLDIIEEETLMEWYNNLKEDESPILQQKALNKFFDWLQEASEESESD